MTRLFLSFSFLQSRTLAMYFYCLFLTTAVMLFFLLSQLTLRFPRKRVQSLAFSTLVNRHTNRQTKQTIEDKSPEIESVTMTPDHSATMTSDNSVAIPSSRFSFFPKRKFASVKYRKKNNKTGGSARWSLPESEILRDSCRAPQRSSLLGCTTCSPNSSPENSLMSEEKRLSLPPKIEVVPQSIRKLSDYKFPRT